MTTLTKLKKYVLRRVLEDGGEEFIAHGGVTTDVDEILSWGSRLSAERWLETRSMDGLVWKPFLSADVEVKPKVFEPPFDLAIKDPLEAVRRVCQWHWEYCERIERWLIKAGVETREASRPTPCMTITSPTWAGLYSSGPHSCHYPAVYAMMAADYDKIVVAHEVVHAYQRQFTGHRSGHGPDFYAMMRHGMGVPINDHHHTYSVSEARRLSAKLLPWWQMAKERGVLQSLPCEVLTTKVKRTGVRCDKEPPYLLLVTETQLQEGWERHDAFVVHTPNSNRRFTVVEKHGDGTVTVVNPAWEVWKRELKGTK